MRSLEERRRSKCKALNRDACKSYIDGVTMVDSVRSLDFRLRVGKVPVGIERGEEAGRVVEEDGCNDVCMTNW